MNTSPFGDRTKFEQIDSICDRFEKAWKTGSPPLIENFLADVPEVSPALFRALLELDYDYNKQQGRSITKENYLARFPQFAQQIEALFASQESQLNQIGDYLLQKELGEGGMGRVYKAWHSLLHRTVAIKIIKADLQHKQSILDRFKREIKITGQMSHPNLVQALDAGVQEELVFLVMEFIEGESLYTKVKKEGPFQVVDAINYSLQTANGLAYLHEKGLIHRDIKPGNVMITADDTIKVLDLGLVAYNQAHSQEETMELTEPGEVLGTVDFMAPEQAVETSNADHRVDIYSLGCTLFFLLKGKPPYQGKTIAARLIAHRETKVPSLLSYPNISRELNILFQRMLAKNPSDRPQNMHEVISALEIISNRIRPGGSATETIDITQAGNAIYSSSKRTFTVAKPKIFFVGIVAGALFLCGFAAIYFWLGNGKDRDDFPPKNNQQPAKNHFKSTPGNDFPIKGSPRDQLKWVIGKLINHNQKYGYDGSKTKLNLVQGHYKLVISHPGIRDITPIQKLTFVSDLDLEGTNVQDLSPIKNLRIFIFDCNSMYLKDISPLSEMPLEYLELYGCTNLKDIGPVKNFKNLKFLNLADTQVEDLTPLANLPLNELFCCDNTPVRDLKVLATTNITYLSCENCKNLQDLSPLQNLPLEVILCDERLLPTAPFLRKCKTLRMINNKPPRKYWKQIGQ